MDVNVSRVSQQTRSLQKNDSSTFRASPNNYMVARDFSLQKKRYVFFKLLVQIVTNGSQKVGIQSVKFHLVCLLNLVISAHVVQSILHIIFFYQTLSFRLYFFRCLHLLVGRGEHFPPSVILAPISQFKIEYKVVRAFLAHLLYLMSL